MQKKEEKIREYLKRLNMTEVFACLDEKDMAGLSFVNYKKGEYLFHTGDKIEAVFFLLKGKCRISNSTSEGKEIAIDFDIPSGRMIGEMELASGIDFFHSVAAASDSIVLRIPLEIAEKKLMKDPAFLRYICRQLAWELTESGRERVRVGLYDARERVARCLYGWAMRTREPSFTISCRQTALECAISERHLNRIFHSMEEEGIIERYRNKIRILDMELLQSRITEV